MQRAKLFAVALLAGLFLCSAPHSRAAQLSVSVHIGPQPVCPYGYFPYAPYNCAPYGYYGPSWFRNGVFIGAGPWFHGPESFHGYVDERFSPRHGYHGRLPRHGTRGRWHPDHNFHGTEEYNGHGKPWHGNEHGHGHARPENHGNGHGHANAHPENHGHEHGHSQGNGHGHAEGHGHDHGGPGNGNGNGNGNGH